MRQRFLRTRAGGEWAVQHGAQPLAAARLVRSARARVPRAQSSAAGSWLDEACGGLVYLLSERGVTSFPSHENKILRALFNRLVNSPSIFIALCNSCISNHVRSLSFRSPT